jgi:Flp pilus assembly protein TadB
VTGQIAGQLCGYQLTGYRAAGPAGGSLGAVPLLAAGLVFAGLLIVVLFAAWPRSAKQGRISQITHFGPGRATPRTVAGAAPAGTGAVARTLLNASASLVRSGGTEDQIRSRLEQAGLRLRPHEWVLIRVCAAVTGAGALLAFLGPIGALLGLVAGWLASTGFRLVRRDRRREAFTEQLPDALQLVIGSLKSGFSLTQAMDALVRESPEPVAGEFGRALTENRLGVDISDALERVAVRTGSEDLGWAVMAVRIQRDVGGNLAEVLQSTVDTMRERSRLRRHVRSLTAEGRLSAGILIALPLVLGVFMFVFRHEYLRPLFTDPIGRFMLVGSLGLMAGGVFWMSRMVRVKV